MKGGSLNYVSDFDDNNSSSILTINNFKLNKAPTLAKILLANEATNILHGSKAAKESEETAKTTFVQGGVGKNIPEKKLSKEIISKGINIIDLVSQNGLASSKSDARRILKNRGIKINDKVIEDEKKIVSLKDFSNNNYIKLSVGKKTHLKVTIT